MRIGIIGAMEEEIRIYTESMKIRNRNCISSREFIQGDLCGKEVVVCQAGVGKVNAASCTQSMIDWYKPTHIIVTGCAGALNDTLKIGDMVISDDCIQYDFDASALGYTVGEIMLMDKREFIADYDLIRIASVACTKEKIYYKVGRVLTADKFVSDKKVKRDLRTYFNGDCAEMEGAAIAQVCYLNKIPFVILRDISDSADGDSIEDFNRFLKDVSDTNVRVVKSMIELTNKFSVGGSYEG